MATKRISAALFLIFCVAGFLSAQEKKSPSDQYTEQLQIERETAENAKRAEAITAARAAALFLDSNLFLPIENDSWAVSITSNGGIMGGSRLIAALNSDGNFQCSSKNGEYRNNFVDKTIFSEISRAAKSEFPRLQPGNNELSSPPVSFCSDCSYETLNIVLRRNKKVEIFQFNLRQLAASKSELKQIYEKIPNFSECR